MLIQTRSCYTVLQTLKAYQDTDHATRIINYTAIIYSRILLVVCTFIQYSCVEWDICVAEKVRGSIALSVLSII
jgi:hypothetical protein